MLYLGQNKMWQTKKTIFDSAISNSTYPAIKCLSISYVFVIDDVKQTVMVSDRGCISPLSVYSRNFALKRHSYDYLYYCRGKKKLAGPFAPGQEVGPKIFAVTHDAKLIFSGGLWDNSIRVYSAAKGKTVQNIVRHTGQLYLI